MEENENVEINNEIKLEEETHEDDYLSKLDLNIEICKEFSYVDYHADGLWRAESNAKSTYLSFIKSIEVVNATGKIIPGLVITFSFENEAFNIDDIHLPPCPSPAGYIRLPWLKVKKPILDAINETIPSEVIVRLIKTGADNDICISEQKINFNILPISQPTDNIFSEKRLFAKYVTPLAPCVKQITNKAVIYNEGNPIIAYQNKDANDMLKEIQAIYSALHAENILYQNPPAKDNVAQRLRMPEEVIRDKKATCLDSTILFCSCLAEVGYHPIMVLIDGHAFCGVFLNNEDYFEGGQTDKLAEIINRTAKDSQTIVLIETTFITSGHGESLKASITEAKNHISLYNGLTFNAVDVNTCHINTIFSPIPVEGNDFELENYIKQKEIQDEELSKILSPEENYINVESKYKNDRFKTWENRLLDLVESNRLLNYKPNVNSSVRVLSRNNLTEILCTYDEIDLNIISLTHEEAMTSFMSLDESVFESAYSHFNSNDILIFGLEKTLKNIVSKAKSAVEETGASPLYLCLGMLNYYSPKSNRRNAAPFLLLPINIKRASGGKRYIMSYDIGDLRINDTFFEYYKLLNPEVEFSSLLSFDDLTKYRDVVRTFRDICGEDIALEDNYFFISNVSFAHQVMWLDMVKRKDELAQNIVVKSFVDNTNHIKDEVIKDEDSIEELEKYEDFAAPLYYDSSQLKAILDCGAGKSFILDGPPGTGKSQTIVNMIANAFYNNKKVLFVAEKKAALDVVYDRMERLGLGNYCLELHSNKATKADFFSKLGKAMEAAQAKKPEEYYNACAELTNKKNELRNYLNKIHDKSKYIMSLYECIVALNEFEYLSDYKITFDKDFVSSFDKEKLNRIYKLIENYETNASGVHNFDGTPLKAFGIQQLNFMTDREILKNDMNSTIVAIDDLLNASNKLFSKLPFKLETNDYNIEALFEILDYIDTHKLYPNLLTCSPNDVKEIFNGFDLIKEFIAAENNVSDKYDADQILKNIDVCSILHNIKNTKGIFRILKARKNAIKQLQPYVKFKLTKQSLGYTLFDLEELFNKKENIIKHFGKFNSILETDTSSIIEDYSNILAIISDTLKFKETVVNFAQKINQTDAIKFFYEATISNNSDFRVEYEFAKTKYLNYKEKDKILLDKYLLNKNCLANKGNYFTELKKLLKYAADPEYFIDLVNLTNVNKLNNGFKKEGVLALIDQIVFENCRVSELKDLLKISLAISLLPIYFEDEQINGFSGDYFEEQAKLFKEKIKQYSETTVQCIAAKISADFARNDIVYSKDGAIGRLQKSIANNGRGVSIRKALSDYGEIISKYFPCFLMSPLSAAQYLSVESDKNKGFSKFDIVIFDEASQIPTHEAVGPIARGKSLIVAGDPKQMPPSPYFNAGLPIIDEDDEDDDITKYTDSPSLLDECLSIKMPRHKLSYHYRSKHESLIQFSNSHFYGNKLYTFPSSSTSTSFVEFMHIKTKEPKKDSSLSKEELDAITKLFINIYKNPANRNKSLGIISFNIKQADKIIDSITNVLEKDRELAQVVNEAAEKTKEPWFVKSIENVQGDERDIIILTIGFSINKQGYARVGGPLVAGDNNGERRLNVATSRSKEKMIVVSTIRASNFPDDKLIRKVGSKCLKHFLQYAEDCSFNTKSEHKAEPSSILYYIKRDLENIGFKVDANVGNSDFRVDLAIKSDNSDHYELGVLVDSHDLGSEISCRDKLYVQESVLNAMKWKIVRVYALEYFKNPQAVINRIKNAYESDYIRENNVLNFKVEKEDISNLGDIYDMEEYPEIVFPKSNYFYKDDFNEEELKRLTDYLINLLSPISFAEIKRYVGLAYNFYVFNNQRVENLKKYLKLWYLKNRIYDQTQYFYFKDKDQQIIRFRKALNRTVDDISSKEIACAMKQINEIEGGITFEGLCKKLMEAFDFGTRAITKPYRERFEYAYEYAKKHNLI